MTNLPEVADWVDGIYQIEQTDPVLGGPPNLETGAGIANVQAQQLAERTAWLKEQIAAAIAFVITTGTGLNGGGAIDGGLTLTADLADQAVAEAGSNNLQLMTALRTKQAIDVAIDALVGAAPAQLDTLNELAAAITANGDTSAALTALIATKLDAASYTAADILAKLLTVDGAGSGLDADKLDGLSSTTFARTASIISAGTGLTGGGSLSGNRTISADLATQAHAEAGTNATKLMTALRTKQAIDVAVNAVVGAAPAQLDTLNELAAAITENGDASAALTALIATKLNSSSYTAADILAKLKTVDGAGSGLDADNLDGLSSATFARSARVISAGAGLTGGGNLGSNRTISADLASQSQAEAGTDSSKLMTPLRVAQAITAMIADLTNGAPGALDTLNELAAALGDDPDFAATVTAQLAQKVSETRAIATGAGLNGGGDLSADRSLSVHFATQAQAEAGTLNNVVMTPLRAKQAALAGSEITAWVNFNGTGVVAIRDSKNVSSITDHGTGAYTINFSTAMITTNYLCLGTPACESDNRFVYYAQPRLASDKLTTSVRIKTGYVSGTSYGGYNAARDLDHVSIAIIGGM